MEGFGRHWVGICAWDWVIELSYPPFCE